MRTIPMKTAIAEATVQMMECDTSIFVMGEGVDDPGGLFGTTKAPHDIFGDARVFDTPLSENAMTGIAVGAALMGMRPILVHARCDFLLLTLDQIVNHAAKWRYMSGGALAAPIVIRAIVGRGWGQGAQHSQSLQATLAHFPGLNVVMPATAHDAKGLLVHALRGSTPTIMIEHRWLHEKSSEVPEEIYDIPFGKAQVMQSGTDVTIVAISQMVVEAEQAAAKLREHGIEAELINLRTIRPWDQETVCASVNKTGHLIIADTSWTAFGIGAEIAAVVGEQCFDQLEAPIRRIGLPPTHTPCAPNLEQLFYPNAATLVSATLAHLGIVRDDIASVPSGSTVRPFKGAF